MDSKIDQPAPVRSRCERTYKDRSSFALLSVLLFLDTVVKNWVLTDSAHGFERHRAGGIDRKLVTFRPILFPIRSLQQSTRFNKGPASLEPREANVHNKPKTIGNRKRDRAWGCARGINTTWENLQIEKYKSVRWTERTPSWFVLFDLQIFSGGVYPPSATSRTISFSISNSFGILIWFIFSMRRRPVQHEIRSFVSVLLSPVTPFDRSKTKKGTCFEECNVFGNGKCELSAIQQGRKRCNFLARKSAKLFANTSLCIIGSAEALPTLCVGCARWERVRDTEWERDGSDVTFIEKEIVREVTRGDKPYLRKSITDRQRTNQEGVRSVQRTDLCFAICRFSQVRFITPSHHTHNLFFYFQ